uniref:Immunoglobulin V-set domain-containing protein n=1 Tax=Neogobius melanostomus TaxID=47308 RepID=A0A8C6U232_9GOBI
MVIRATRGSCLVIPCSYTLPKTATVYSTYNGLWKKGTEQVIVAQSRKNLPHQDYRGRTRFLGSMYKQDCTLLLWDVRDSDAGLYLFRIHLPEYKSYSWTYQPTEVQVERPHLLETPLDLLSPAKPPTTLVSGGAYCSVTHSCPQNPPTLTWNSNGTVRRGSNSVDDGQWSTYSILQPGPPQNTPLELRCTVTYYGGQKLHSTFCFSNFCSTLNHVLVPIENRLGLVLTQFEGKHVLIPSHSSLQTSLKHQSHTFYRDISNNLSI